MEDSTRAVAQPSKPGGHWCLRDGHIPYYLSYREDKRYCVACLQLVWVVPPYPEWLDCISWEIE